MRDKACTFRTLQAATYFLLSHTSLQFTTSNWIVKIIVNTEQGFNSKVRQGQTSAVTWEVLLEMWWEFVGLSDGHLTQSRLTFNYRKSPIPLQGHKLMQSHVLMRLKESVSRSIANKILVYELVLCKLSKSNRKLSSCHLLKRME